MLRAHGVGHVTRQATHESQGAGDDAGSHARLDLEEDVGARCRAGTLHGSSALSP